MILWFLCACMHAFLYQSSAKFISLPIYTWKMICKRKSSYCPTVTHELIVSSSFSSIFNFVPTRPPKYYLTFLYCHWCLSCLAPVSRPHTKSFKAPGVGHCVTNLMNLTETVMDTVFLLCQIVWCIYSLTRTRWVNHCHCLCVRRSLRRANSEENKEYSGMLRFA